MVYEIEYVDANGKVQKINRKDGDLLSTASGCFGLLGVVTRLTLVLDKMTIAHMEPKKLPVIEAIPPPSDMVAGLPDNLKKSYNSYSQDQIKKFVQDFEHHAFNDYYAEWFWFPLHDKMWINTWSQARPGASATDYPSKKEIAEQISESFILETLQEYYRKQRKNEPSEGTKFICMSSFFPRTLTGGIVR